MRRFLLASLMGMLISTLAFGVDIKSQIGTQDLNMDADGAAHGTFQRRTSTGGTITLDKIDGNQIPWSNAYTRTIRPADLITKGPWVDVRAYLPAGYVTDGSVDYSTQVQQALDNITANGTLVIPLTVGVGAASWVGLTIASKSYVSIVGMGGGGFKLLAQPTQSALAGTYHPILKVSSSSHINIVNLVINRNGIESMGIAFVDVSDSSIRNNYIYGAPSTGSVNNLNVGSGGYCYRNTYSGNLIEGGSHGFLLGYNLTNYETGSVITNNRIRNLDGDAIVYVGGHGIIDGNYMDNVNVGALAGCLTGADNTNDIGRFITISNNTINDTIWFGIQMDSVSNAILKHITISGNVLSRTGYDGIYAPFTSYLSIYGNTIYGYGWDNTQNSHGITAGLGGRDVVIANNTIDGVYTTGAAQAGIYIIIGSQGSDNNYIVDGNTISKGYRGIYYASEEGYVSSHHKITNNIITGVGLDGVIISSDDFTDIYFSGNTIKDSARYGLYNAHPVSRQLYGANNVYENNTSGNILGGGPIMIYGNNTAHAFLSAAPTDNTVTWNANDITWKLGTDNVIGWKCTVAGAPGTWKSMTITLEP